MTLLAPTHGQTMLSGQTINLPRQWPSAGLVHVSDRVVQHDVWRVDAANGERVRGHPDVESDDHAERRRKALSALAAL